MATAELVDLRTTRRCFNCEAMFHQSADAPSLRCAACEAKHNRAVEAEKARRRDPSTAWRTGLFRAITWRGFTIGLYPVMGPDGETRFRSRAIVARAAQVPQGKLMDLNGYLVGFDRHQVQRFKADIKSCHRLDADPPRLNR